MSRPRLLVGVASALALASVAARLVRHAPRAQPALAAQVASASAPASLPLAGSLPSTIAPVAPAPVAVGPSPAAPSLATVAPAQPAGDEIARLREELDGLRARLATAEAAASAQARLSEQVLALGQQLVALRAELAAERERRAEAAERGEATASDRQEAITALVDGEAQLATGDTTGVDDALQRAASVLGPTAREALDAAREALANEDLADARAYLRQALAQPSAP